MNNGLEFYSPKFNRMLNNINKFVSTESKGKILFYSEFRADSGAEIFELILQANGYHKFNPKEGKSKKLRYTFITGSENIDERIENLKAYNDENNKYGEYIQIMIISGAGAEGISLTCVRQVHILEPYWNYIRIDQVFGRAIRMLSHKDLSPLERNVEQYLYLSVFPEGITIVDIYKSISELGTWQIPKIEGDIQTTLFETNKEIYDSIQKIIRIKTESINTTADQKLFNIMEKKNKLSTIVSDIIKESSVDCLQNTRDDINIHQSCVQFDKKIIDETSYFPGITAETLNIVDKKQLEATFIYFLEPNIYIVSALIDKRNVYTYFRLNTKEKNLNDIRYIKDNGKMIGILDLDFNLFFLYKSENHILDEKLGNKLSVFQELFIISDDILTKINDDKIFPNLTKLTTNLFGYKLKYNITERFYFYPLVKK